MVATTCIASADAGPMAMSLGQMRMRDRDKGRNQCPETVRRAVRQRDKLVICDLEP